LNTSAAAASIVRFRIDPFLPQEHLYRVQCAIETPAAGQPPAGGQTFRLPSWIRGSYLVRDFAKHVQALVARCDGEEVAIERLDKRSFRVPCGGRIELDYQVHAFDPSVRKAWLDTRRGFFNASSLCYRPDGFEHAVYELEIRRPEPSICAGFRLATALRPVEIDADGFGLYRAGSYEELIDCPVEMADFQRVDFDVDGIPHSLVLSGRCEADLPRVAADLAKICHVEREMFEQEPAAGEGPGRGFDRYLFLTQVTPNGYGGLEHRTSTALVTARDALPKPGDANLRKGYRGFLGLVSHEYFHLWNVKRITPLRFAESELAAEAYSKDLWAYEGVTSYYDDLFLLRAELLDAPAYLDLLAEGATRLQRTPGRRVQTLADASFEAWIKYYQPDEQTPNAAVNYYVKGALVALCLDLTLRRDSAITLDDVMRALWRDYGRYDRPVPEGDLERIAELLSGLELKPLFDRWLRSTEELPLAETLADFGVIATLHAARGAQDEGGRSHAPPSTGGWIGASFRADASIATVFSGSPAARAGLAPGDGLLAVDGLRVTGGIVAQRIEALQPEREIEVHFYRGDELLSTRLTPTAAPADTWTLTLAEVSGPELTRRQAWLGA
jgi:predicted metalloprotease with PDZ domain